MIRILQNFVLFDKTAFLLINNLHETTTSVIVQSDCAPQLSPLKFSLV